MDSKQLKKILLVVLVVATHPAHAQNYSLGDRLQKTLSAMSKGVLNAFEWYELPIVVLYHTHSSPKPLASNRKIRLSTFEIDRSVESLLGREEGHSLGSMDKDFLPHFIMMTKLAYSVGKSLSSADCPTPQEFRSIAAFYKSLMYTHVLTELVKNTTERSRPDGSDTRSFFSGHTSAAFTTSSFLVRELDDLLDEWDGTRHNSSLRTALKTACAVGLYGWAGYVGWSRMRDSKHYLSDVLVGAAAGIVVGILVYDSSLSSKPSYGPQVGFASLNNTPSIIFSLRF